MGGYQDSWCDLKCSTMEGSCELQVGAVWGLLAAVPLAGISEHLRCLEEPSEFSGAYFMGAVTALPPNSPLVHGIKWSCGNGTEEFSVEQLVQQILDTHPTKPAPRTHACLCSGGLGE